MFIYHEQQDVKHHIIVLFIRVGAFLLVLLLCWGLYEKLKQSKPKPVLEIQEITLMADIPEPELEEPEPVIEEIEEEVEVETVDVDESMPDDMPPMLDDALGLDSDGEAGMDSFNLRAKKGGRSIIDGAGGGSGDGFKRYAGELEKKLLEILERHDEVRQQSYRIDVAIWLDKDGYVQRLEPLGRVTPMFETLEKIMLSSRIKLQAPPAGLNLPVKLRIRSTEIG